MLKRENDEKRNIKCVIAGRNDWSVGTSSGAYVSQGLSEPLSVGVEGGGAPWHPGLEHKETRRGCSFSGRPRIFRQETVDCP
jgi:hypothetical protein